MHDELFEKVNRAILDALKRPGVVASPDHQFNNGLGKLALLDMLPTQRLIKVRISIHLTVH